MARADIPEPPDHSLRRVLEISAPIGLAFIPLGMALGLLVVHAGLAWWWAPVFAAVIYAGSLEFLMVGMAAWPSQMRSSAHSGFAARIPPSTLKKLPVMKEARSLARNAASGPTSAGSPIRPAG